MQGSRCCIIAILLLAAFAIPATAAMPSDTAASVVIVHVRDLSSNPVAARVLVVGTSTGESYQRLTDTLGESRFNVQSGRYWITVEAHGYQEVRTQIVLGLGEVREITFALADLKLIGRVRSHSDADRVLSEPTNTARRISPNLAEALSTVAAVSATGNDNALGIRASLQGGDESLTSYGMAGAPLPANAAALAINTDLIQTVQFDQSRELVQFAGLSSTAAPVYQMRARTGSYGAAFESVSFQDTLGATGIAMLHTLRSAQSPLNGSVYEDTSGASYRHVGALHTTGDYIKADGPIGSFAGSAQTSVSRNSASPLSTYFAGRLPMGTGPGERADIATRNSVVTLNGSVASTSVALTYADVVVDSRDLQPDRLVDGVGFPFDLLLRTYVNTFSVSVERGVSGTLTADGSLQVFNQSTTSTLGGVRTGVSDRTYQTTFGIRHAARESDGWSAEYRGGRSGNAAYGSFNARIARRLSEHLAVVGVASAGTIAQEGNEVRQARGWIAPYEASFDCADGTVVTEGPGDSRSTPHRVRLFGSLTSNAGAVHLSASAWYTRLRGEMLSGALVPLRADDPSLPASYVSALIAEADSPLRCGSSGEQFAVFGRRDVGGANITNRGVSASLSTDRGSLHAELSVEFVSARLDSAMALVAGPTSFYVPGRQLIGVPPFRSTLLLDWLLGRKTELLGSVHVESSNNSRNLPSYATVAAGLSRRMSPTSSLTIVAGNVFNTYAGTMVSPRYAVPVRTLDGSWFRGVAAPLPPARLSLQYDLRLER